MRIRAHIPVLAGLLCAAVPAPALAAGAAQDSGASFLARAGAPGQVAPVCMLDTGVNETAGLAGALLGREELAGGEPGEAGVPHGTRVAAAMLSRPVAGADPGIFKYGQVRSVRLSAITMTTIAAGIDRCAAAGASVIQIALAGPEPSAAERAELTDAVARARAGDAVVVAAAGNQNGAPVGYPAAIDGVIAVGAGRDGEFCEVSSRGPQVDVLAPGCGTSIPDGEGGVVTATGTSYASALTSAVLAALRSYQPMSGPQAERLLLSSARQGAAGASLDAAAAFRAAGLGALITPDPRPSDTGEEQAAQADEDGAADRAPVLKASAALGAPRAARARFTRRGLTVSVTGRRGPARLLISVRNARYGPYARSAMTLTRTRLGPIARPRVVKVAFADGSRRSRWVTVKVR